MNGQIWFHADDYGVTPEQSRRILSCFTQGSLNSISVLPNSEHLVECRDILDEIDKERRIRRVLHVNLVEGRPLADKERVGLLVDEQGMFCCSFVKLWMWNYIFHGNKRKKLKQQLKCEIAAQLEAVTKRCDYHITAVDSHQHYHMIPVVFDALMEVIDESGVSISEIRIPVDPVRPALFTGDKPHKIPLINWIKWLILRPYVGRTKRRLHQRGITTPVFFGIFYTCDMRLETVQSLLPAYEKYAMKQDKMLELMFHPGNLMTRGELFDERRDELAEFYMSQNRYAEAQCLKNIDMDIK